LYFFFQAEDGIRDFHVTGVQTCALPILTVVYPGSTFMGETVRTDGNNSKFKTPQTGFTFKKYSIYDAGAPATVEEAQIGENRSEINYMILRYADILLRYAESKNELGELTSYISNTRVREVRRRAGFSAASALDYPGKDRKS